MIMMHGVAVVRRYTQTCVWKARAILVFVVLANTRHVFSVETDVVLHVRAELVLSAGQKTPIYVSGDPIRIKCSLSNATEKSVSILWDPGMFFFGNVGVWLRKEFEDERLVSYVAAFPPFQPPTTAIPPGGLVKMEDDVLRMYDPSTCLYQAPTSRVLFEPGDYFMEIAFSFQQTNGLPSDVINVQSERLHFRVISLDAKGAKALLPRVTKRERNLNERIRCFDLLLINLPEKERADLIQRWLGAIEPEMRLSAINACERYPNKEFTSTIWKLFLEDDDIDVRDRAVGVYKVVAPCDYVPALIQWAERPKSDDRRWAVNLLAETGDRRTLPALRKILGEKGIDEDTKSMVSRTIKSIENRQPGSAVTSPK
jgi:hypothetical protein